jgi:zinc/manganese transport system substrate-binding protein
MPNIRNLLFSAGFAVVTLTIGAEAKLKAVASFSIIGDLVARVGGDAIELDTIVGRGSDSHAYEPKPDDAKKIASANIVFSNGLGFDSWVGRLHKASGSNAEVIELAAASKSGLRETGEDGDHDNDHDHNHDHYDPHVWQDPRHVEGFVKTIADYLCKLDSQNCDEFESNAAALTHAIKTVDAEIKAAFSQIPTERRIVITSHDAFGYFADAYNVRFLAPEGISTDAEASARDVAVLIKQIRKAGAAALFTETITDPRLLQQIADETGLSIGGELYSDALSDETGPAATYIDMMRHNSRILAKAMKEAVISAN